MNPRAEHAITIGQAVILQLHQRNRIEAGDDADYIPTLKTVINAIVSTDTDSLNRHQIQQSLHNYARELYMQVWMTCDDDDEEDSPDHEQGLTTFDYLYQYEQWPE